MTGITTARAWSSKWSPLSDDIHQLAVERALNTSLTNKADIKILQEVQKVADAAPEQVATNSYKHCMTGLLSKEHLHVNKPVYIRKANEFIHANLIAAIEARLATNMGQSFTNLGLAIHALQDATSPAHEKFLPWTDDEGIWRMAWHVSKERVYPNATNEKILRDRLHASVRWAYALYLGPVADIPSSYFDADGSLDIPTQHFAP